MLLDSFSFVKKGLKEVEVSPRCYSIVVYSPNSICSKLSCIHQENYRELVFELLSSCGRRRRWRWKAKVKVVQWRNSFKFVQALSSHNRQLLHDSRMGSRLSCNLFSHTREGLLGGKTSCRWKRRYVIMFRWFWEAAILACSCEGMPRKESISPLAG